MASHLPWTSRAWSLEPRTSVLKLGGREMYLARSGELGQIKFNNVSEKKSATKIHNNAFMQFIGRRY